MKAKNLEKKLEMYQSVKVAIDGTLPGTQDIPLIYLPIFYLSSLCLYPPELMERLNSMEDLSDDARYSLR